jgi:hypothetical protein
MIFLLLKKIIIMHIEVIIIVSSVLLYTCKCYRLNECKKRFENNIIRW